MNRIAAIVLLLTLGFGGVVLAQDEASGAVGTGGERGASAGGREVNLLSMGDWGYRDNRKAPTTQQGVADAMAEHVKRSGRRYDAMITAGDNLYVKLSGVDDPQWGRIFEKAYDPGVLKFPFYIALGNHDYEKMPDGRLKYEIELEYAKKNPRSRWKMPARWYRLDFPEDRKDGEPPLVSVLVLDSYKNGVGDALWAEQLQWLQGELAKPRKGGGWLIAVAHHPLYSNGDHGDNGVLQREWGPLFDQYGLDLYVAGHDHDLQHLEIPQRRPSFVLVGGGGATTRPMRNDQRGPFSRATFGFGDLHFTPTLATVRIIGRDGSTLHAFTRTRNGEVEVTRTTPSDKATPRTVRSVTRGGDERAPTTRPATVPAAAN